MWKTINITNIHSAQYEDRIKQEKNTALQKTSSKNGVWDEVVDRKTGNTCYYNRITETASNTKPIEVELGEELDEGIPPRLDRMINPDEEKSAYLEVSNCGEQKIKNEKIITQLNQIQIQTTTKYSVASQILGEPGNQRMGLGHGRKFRFHLLQK
tara:strand:- start:62 stop:526 length:465 start_codon:yes stop_codon:yes gene_type:complete